MVVYEFEMVERFLDNSVFLDIPTKFLYLAQCYCLAMFALKLILKNVQKLDVSLAYVRSVIVEQKGLAAMLMATQVALDMFEGKDISYLVNDDVLGDKTHINPPVFFTKQLHAYVFGEKELFTETEASQERNTRAPSFTLFSAKEAIDDYTRTLWQCIEKRVKLTDLSDSACVFSEAPAETIFSIYSRVTQGREALSISNAVALTRIAAHGPPVATKYAEELTKLAMASYQSKYGARFCTNLWVKGATSTTVKKKVQKKVWEWCARMDFKVLYKSCFIFIG